MIAAEPPWCVVHPGPGNPVPSLRTWGVGTNKLAPSLEPSATWGKTQRDPDRAYHCSGLLADWEGG